MSAQDYRVNAEVRRLLVSRWIDVSRIQIGTTNGVVYLMGTFEPTIENALERSGFNSESQDPAERLIRLIVMVEKELRRIRGVRDMVFTFRNVRKRGRTWSVVGAEGSASGSSRSSGGGGVAARGTGTTAHDISDELEDEGGKKDAKATRRA